MSLSEALDRSEKRVDTVCKAIRDVREGDNCKIILDQFFMLSTTEQRCVLMYIMGGNETRNDERFIELSKIASYGAYMKSKKSWSNKPKTEKVE